ncbi:MAG: hypothetical protein WCA46_01000 [Actinocatenispora sp.]
MDIRAIQARPDGAYEVVVADADSSVTVLVTAEGTVRDQAPGVDPAPIRDAVRALHHARVQAGAW